MHAEKIHKGCNKIRVHFYVLVEVLLLLLPTTSVLKRRKVPATVSSFSVSATTTAVSFFDHSIAVAAVGRGTAAYISTEAERGTGSCFFLLRFCP